MNPYRYFIPNNMIMPGYNVPMRSNGIFNRLFQEIKGVNWGGILNNANKTLNVVNQTIPLVKQVGPMVNNMRSMFKIARAFGNETSRSSNKVSNKKNNTMHDKELKKEVNILDNNDNLNDAPSFFV